MKNPRTGELKVLKVGFSWVLFLLSPFFGIPLFLRRLYLLGGLMIAINIASSALAGASTASNPSGLFIGLLIQAGFLAYLGAKGNELTAKSLLDKGWIFAKPESLEAQYASSRWGIELPATPAQQPAGV
ncbi:hypothetical protein [Xanthobacter versatilis]|uniref:hypothetical protein n=1 Tax=Xanthobacter autotrophicus (strain ATCC BAA-1158 / Py2) TaxID=78245 RepID=UPI00372ABEB4